MSLVTLPVDYYLFELSFVKIPNHTALLIVSKLSIKDKNLSIDPAITIFGYV